MRIGRWRTRISVCILLLLLGLGSMSVMAQENSKGSITILLNDIGSDKKGVKFQCYQVAVPEDAVTWTWETKVCFTGAGVDLNSLENSADYQEAAQKLADCKEKKKAKKMSGFTDSNGQLIFNNLDSGIYLIEQADPGTYGKVAPFLAAVPSMDGNTYIYDVEAHVKGEKFPTATPAKDADKDHSDTTGSGSAAVKTADNSPILLLVWMSCAAALAISGILIQKHKKNKTEL